MENIPIKFFCSHPFNLGFDYPDNKIYCSSTINTLPKSLYKNSDLTNDEKRLCRLIFNDCASEIDHIRFIKRKSYNNSYVIKYSFEVWFDKEDWDEYEGGYTSRPSNIIFMLHKIEEDSHYFDVYGCGVSYGLEIKVKNDNKSL